jgi:hypothetical protein
VSWIPLSVPVMAGMAFGTAAYFGLHYLVREDQTAAA